MPNRPTLATLLLTAAFHAFAGEVRMPDPAGGTLTFTEPGGWRHEVTRQQGLATASFVPKTGTPFQVLVSPLPFNRATSVPVTRESVRAYVSRAADKAKAQSVETELPIRAIVQGKVFGSYFSATDRSFGGGYKYMAQGVLAVDDRPIAFTVLSHGDSRALLDATVRMLQSARNK